MPDSRKNQKEKHLVISFEEIRTKPILIKEISDLKTLKSKLNISSDLNVVISDTIQNSKSLFIELIKYLDKDFELYCDDEIIKSKYRDIKQLNLIFDIK
ncbi:MAG: hypothetical protein ACOCV1_08240 [Bacillota bacterium]